jgi:hypothetical protein
MINFTKNTEMVSTLAKKTQFEKPNIYPYRIHNVILRVALLFERCLSI